MEPGLQKLAGELDGKVSIAKIDFDASPDLIEKYSVDTAGTFVLLRDGKEVDRVATSDVEALKTFVESSL